ncbi:MAG: hypothetical protein H8D45_12780, partial [Bacteroidetes bacterium]|nr:hypothetical protein [Bacteroidota bacterium]
MHFKLFLRIGSDVKVVYEESDIQVPSNNKFLVFGPFDQAFLEEEFPQKGEYVFVARINSLMENTKGVKLDEKKRTFYLEEDPPRKGLIEGTEPMGYPDEINYLMGEVLDGSRGGYILRYNTNHLEYLMVSDYEDDLAAYLFRILSLELCRIDLGREESVLFKDIDVTDPMDVVKKSLEVFG